MISLYQPVDLTVYSNAKAFTKRIFTEWFATQISEAFKKGKASENVYITLNLSTLKPLQAKCIIKPYNKMTSEPGKNVTLKGWEKLGLT